MTPLLTDGLVWIPASEIAREYNRTPRLIRVWCSTGFLIELGYRIRRDATGHWIVGVPHSQYRNFRHQPEIAEPTI